jgi:hypothetical protein
MSQNGVLVVLGAVLMGALGGVATSLKPANSVASVPKPADPSGPANEIVSSPAALQSGATVPKAEGPKAQGPSAPANRPGVATVTPVKMAPKRELVTAKKTPVKKTPTKSKPTEDAEAKLVASVCNSFISAAKAGNASSIAAVVTASQREPLQKRTKWASGAGMDSYRQFGKSVVKTLSTKINGDKAEVRLANKTDVEGTDSQYVKSRKFNRREAFINLVKENGQWKVSGFSEGFRVWNE